MVTQLKAPVSTLEQLKATLELLHRITDLQNVIDDMYFPIEKLYNLLRYSITYTSTCSKLLVYTQYTADG